MITESALSLILNRDSLPKASGVLTPAAGIGKVLVDRLKKAHKMAIDKNWNVTDDASLFEMLNWKVKIIEGTYSNIKITSPIDLKIAKLFLKNS